MRPIHTTKRLYSIAASPPLKTVVRSTPTSPRPRRASLSLASAVGSPSSSSASSTPANVVGSPGARSLYNASGSLHYFDSAGLPPPPPPPPTSRPSNPHIVSTSRLSVSEAQSQNAPSNPSGNGTSTNSAQSSHAPHAADGTLPAQQTSHGQSHHGQASGGQQAEAGSQPLLGSSSLMLSLGGPAPPLGSSPPDHSFLLNGPRSGFGANPSWRSREATSDPADRQANEELSVSATSAGAIQKIYQLEVGAYGIPKRGRESARRRNCVCPTCIEEAEVPSLEFLDGAVQVGEDAYFVRDDALGVADGVGGWGSRHSAGRPSSVIHSCSTCAAASSSKMRHFAQGHRQPYRAHNIQPSPSALFARRLMHFCSHEISDARNAATANKSGNLDATQRVSDPVAQTTTPSLKHGGIATRVGRQKTVVREHGNARPFTWPWENSGEPEYSTGLGVLVEKDLREKAASHVQVSIAAQAPEDTNNSVPPPDPLEGTIDPIDVLERAYSKTIDAHRVRRRVRVVKVQKSAPRWWSYGLGLGSGVPSPSSASLREAVRHDADSDELDNYEWEWQESWEPLSTGSSTALLAVLSGNRLRVAHLGDCVGWLVRAGEIVWRSEEMWWGFNYPVQLGPSSPTRPSDARRYELSVQADDILILASDGVSDNCWEEDVLDEVRRAVEVHLPLARDSSAERKESSTAVLLGRRTLAGMLSEALCSRARELSMQKRSSKQAAANVEKERMVEDEELPFERRAREEGRSFRGGKSDDISVIVAIISPIANGQVISEARAAEHIVAPSPSATELSGSVQPIPADA